MTYPKVFLASRSSSSLLVAWLPLLVLAFVGLHDFPAPGDSGHERPGLPPEPVLVGKLVRSSEGLK